VPMPEWQVAAGGKLDFDVVSVRENPNPDDPSSVNVPYGPEDAYTNTSGIFSAKNWRLVSLIAFAFKNSTGAARGSPSLLLRATDNGRRRTPCIDLLSEPPTQSWKLVRRSLGEDPHSQADARLSGGTSRKQRSNLWRQLRGFSFHNTASAWSASINRLAASLTGLRFSAIFPCA
jgi:hypothetical protein